MPGFFVPKSEKMKDFEVIIVGGGLAGLTAGIHLARKGVKTVIFEKEVFPHHKVCGEYLSREVLPYFKSLGIEVLHLKPKNIQRLKYSTAKGNFLEVNLPLGGLGISRYTLDDQLFRTALKNGAEVIQEKVTEVAFSEDYFKVSTSGDKEYSAKYVFGAFGKRSLLDKKMERGFFRRPAPWMAVKTHFTNKDFPGDLVALHNFKGGYCGLSKTENEEVNFCYLATYNSFKKYKDPELFNQKVLRKNPFLDSFLSSSSPVFEQPLTIAQVSFSEKKAVENHVLMLGDAAGLIHPLCGNGMAMAVHSGKLASEVLLKHLEKKTSRKAMEAAYQKLWESHFKTRLKTGKWLQKILLKDSLAEFSQSVVSTFPFLLPKIIERTHGSPIV